MMEEDDVPSSPPPPTNNTTSSSNRQAENTANNTNMNNTEQYSHLRTFYQLQNMLTRQLIQSQQPQTTSNNNDHVAINMAQDSPRNNNTNNTGNNNGNNTGNNANANAGETIGTQGIDGSRFDLQLIGSWLEQSFPFVLLLILMWVYQHRNGILVFVWASAIFINANQALKRQVALKEKRNVMVLGLIAAGLFFHISFTYFYFREEELWRYLVPLPPKKHLIIWDTFWIVIVNDFIVRFATMIVKCLVIIFVGHVTPHKRNTQLYSLIESASNATVLPLSLWFKYMFKASELFYNLISLMYLLAKFNHFYDRCVVFVMAFRSFLFREVQYGKYASREQVMEAGDQCTICQETMASPIVLHCNHIFCEDCVSEWFEREKTCPLCRAQVPTAGNRSHSDGSTSFL